MYVYPCRSKEELRYLISYFIWFYFNNKWVLKYNKHLKIYCLIGPKLWFFFTSIIYFKHFGKNYKICISHIKKKRQLGKEENLFQVAKILCKDSKINDKLLKHDKASYFPIFSHSQVKLHFKWPESHPVINKNSIVLF